MAAPVYDTHKLRKEPKAQMYDHQDKHAIAFTRIALKSEEPSISGTSVCFNHVGVTTYGEIR